MDPDRPIGMHVLTALEQLTGDTKVRRSAVSLDGRPQAAWLDRAGAMTATLGRC